MWTNREQRGNRNGSSLLLHTVPCMYHIYIQPSANSTSSCSFLLSSFTSLFFCLFPLWSTRPSAPFFLSFSPRHLVSPDLHSSPPCLTRSSLLCLLSSPLLLFLFPLHSLMLRLSQHNDPCTETGEAGPAGCQSQDMSQWDERISYLSHFAVNQRRQEEGKNSRQRHGGALYFPLPLCVCVFIQYNCVCE